MDGRRLSVRNELYVLAKPLMSDRWCESGAVAAERTEEWAGEAAENRPEASGLAREASVIPPRVIFSAAI